MGRKLVARRRHRSKLVGTEFLYNIHHSGHFIDNPFSYDGGEVIKVKGLEYFTDWGSFVEFMRRRDILGISKIYYATSIKVKTPDDVRLIWDVKSAVEAGLRLLERRELSLYCEIAEGTSIYDPIIEAAAEDVESEVERPSLKRKVDFDATNESLFFVDKGKEVIWNIEELEEYDQDEYFNEEQYVFAQDEEEKEEEREENAFEFEENHIERNDEEQEERNDDEQEPWLDGYSSEYIKSDEEVDAIEDQVETEEGIDTEVSYRKTKWPRYLKGVSQDFVNGLRLNSKEELRELATTYAVREHRDIYFKKSDKSRAELRCVKGCPFRVWASYTRKIGCWQIKAMQEEHKCNKVYKLKLATSKWLANKFYSDLRGNPNMRRAVFKENVKTSCKLEITNKMAKRVKRVFRTNSKGTSPFEYSLLKDYVVELRRSNPGSTVVLNVEPSTDGVGERFKNLYICFDACKRGFKEGCRRLIGVDGCFLKCATKGQMLTAIGRDANDQMYPIAWAIVSIENKENWLWFLTLLREDLEIDDEHKWVIQSDQQKGLVPALASLLPSVEHRLCARHILTNWQKNHGGDILKGYFWRCADSTSEREFTDNLELIAQYPNAATDLLKTDPKHWSKAFFNREVKCDSNQNNLCEAFNGVRVVLKAREKPIYSLCEDIRKYLMARFNEKRIFGEKWKSTIGPDIQLKLDDSVKDYQVWRVTFNGESGYEVNYDLDQHTVHLEKRTCSCGKWDVTGLPCAHAACCIIDKGHPLEPYVDQCYTREAFMRSYKYSFQPVRGPNVWKKYDGLPVLEPIAKTRSGRPKLKRIKEPGEENRSSQVPNPRAFQLCSVCKLPGHNKKTCTYQPGEKGQRTLISASQGAASKKGKHSHQDLSQPTNSQDPPATAP